MKKLFIALLIVTVFATSAFARTPGVNSNAENHLEATFKNARNVQWVTNGEFLEARFAWNGDKLRVFYNSAGDFVAVSREIELARLPLKALQGIHDKYADYSPAEAIEFNTAEDGLSYYVSLVKDNKKVILQVSAQGEIVVFKKEAK